MNWDVLMECLDVQDVTGIRELIFKDGQQRTNVHETAPDLPPDLPRRWSNPSGLTVLHLLAMMLPPSRLEHAVSRALQDLILELVNDFGADVNHTSKRTLGKTPLHCVCIGLLFINDDHVDWCLSIVNALLAAGAAVDPITDDGLTPLAEAIGWRPVYRYMAPRIACAKSLVRNGASLNRAKSALRSFPPWQKETLPPWVEEL